MQRIPAFVAPALFVLSCLAGHVATATDLGRDLRPHMLGALMYTQVTLDLEGLSPRQAIEFLRAATGVPIVARFEDDEQRLAGLGALPQSAFHVLERIVEQCEGGGDVCTWQLRRAYVEVGSKERLNVAPETRAYQVGDLLVIPPGFENAPTMDMEAALNQGLGGAGGAGGGGGSGSGGTGGRGGGGGSGSGGDGGSLFGPPGEAPLRPSDAELAEELITLIRETIEPDAWFDSQVASIRYHQSVLIVRAPDYIHRQIGGYPRPAPPTERSR